jgi:hypothetical protein
MAASRQTLSLCAPALAVLLSACAGDLRWTKANTDEAEMAKDMAFCRKQAQATYGGAASVAPQPQIDPRFGPTGPTPADRAMQESQAVGSCMRARGYTLVAVDKK